MHLAEKSTSDNLHNCRPSTLLRSVPVENEKCGGGRTETFPILQYKRLASGAIPQLTLMVLDVSGKQISLFNYQNLHLVNINAYTKFDPNPQINSQDIEHKQNSDVDQGP